MLMRRLSGLFACLAVAVTCAAAAQGAESAAVSATPTTTEQTWVSSSGSGLLSLPDTSTLAKKHLDLSVISDNQDRDPLRLDVVDYSVAWNYGIRSGVETYGHVVVSRAVIVASRPSLFPPPVDIILPQGTPVPRRPYYLLYAPFPYVNRTGSSQFSKLVPGDAVLGGKVRLLRQKEKRPALAASFEMKLPMTQALSSLQSGAGTGGVDLTTRLTAERRTRRRSLVASAAFTYVGRPAFGDQLIRLQSGGQEQRTEMPLRLASRLNLGLGFREVLKPSVALVAELTKAVAVGGRTVAYEAAGPLDLTAGGQLRWHRLYLTLGLRYHVNSVPGFETYPSPLAGMADLTSVAPQDRDAYLSAIGAGAAVPYIRDRAQIAVVIPAGGPLLPKGARILPSDFTVRSHDRIATLLVCGWSFGRARK